MNARLQEAREEGEEGGDREVEARAEGGGEEGGDIILGDGRQQQGRCTDSHNWIGKASGYADFEEQRHTTARPVSSRQQIDLSSADSPKLTSSLPLYDPAAVMRPGHVNVSLSADAAAPSSSVTSHPARDNARARARDIETSRWAPTRLPYNPSFPASCNVTRNIAPASCNFAPAPCNNVALIMEQALFRDDGQPVGPQLETCATSSTSAWKNCPQLLMGPVDVEDLAMYFDSSSADNSKPPPPPTGSGGRAIYSRKPRYGVPKVDNQSRQDRRERLDVSSDLLDPYYPRSRYLDPGDLGFAGLPRACQVAANDLQNVTPRTLESNDLPICGVLRPGGSVGPLRPCAPHPGFYDQRATCDLRLGDPRSCVAAARELNICELGRDNLGHDDPASGDWFCNNCPELFNFCSEERWLQCPASDRCPLYDTSYDHGAPLLPPCMYENFHADCNNNDNWYYGYAEDEQLLEDYL